MLGQTQQFRKGLKTKWTAKSSVESGSSLQKQCAPPKVHEHELGPQTNLLAMQHVGPNAFPKRICSLEVTIHCQSFCFTKSKSLNGFQGSAFQACLGLCVSHHSCTFNDSAAKSLMSIIRGKDRHVQHRQQAFFQRFAAPDNWNILQGNSSKIEREVYESIQCSQCVQDAMAPKSRANVAAGEPRSMSSNSLSAAAGT